MRYGQPAVTSVKAIARVQRRREGSPRNEDNVRMATADHDRQGQAAHRQHMKSRVVVEFARQVSPCIIDTSS